MGREEISACRVCRSMCCNMSMGCSVMAGSCLFRAVISSVCSIADVHQRQIDLDEEYTVLLLLPNILSSSRSRSCGASASRFSLWRTQRSWLQGMRKNFVHYSITSKICRPMKFYYIPGTPGVPPTFPNASNSKFDSTSILVSASSFNVASASRFSSSASHPYGLLHIAVFG